ncbi:hypothetical protein BDR04DRAFT_329830 [Suillus decipiens]|nr:hypothetical protein BDR04DRAFT_329830 [Suillus decipiens]
MVHEPMCICCHIVTVHPNIEYSSDDITAARSLQFTTYIGASMTAFLVYDYACSLNEEWTFLLRSKWSKVKGLYIVARYLPFILCTVNHYLNFTSNGNTDRCEVLNNIESGLRIVSVVFSECFFIMRTYILWNKNKILLAAMLSIGGAFLVASCGFAFAVTIPQTYVTSAIPGITGCYQSSTNFQLVIPFFLLSVFELGLMILTLICALRDWQIHSDPLYGVLVKHNIFYYICGFLFSAVNIRTSLFRYSYHTMLYTSQVLILAILATRMHLDLWHTYQRAHDSNDFQYIPMSNMNM